MFDMGGRRDFGGKLPHWRLGSGAQSGQKGRREEDPVNLPGQRW